MILFLDDDHERIKHFRRLCSLEPTVVETAAEAIEALVRQQFNVIFLDHDLGGQSYVDSSREDCGMEVVRWLCRRPAPEMGDPDVIAHSFNGPAALRMLGALEEGGYRAHRIPFGSAIFNSAAKTVRR